MNVCQNNAVARPRGRNIWVFIGILCLVMCGTASADQASNSSAAPNTDLTKAPGRAIAQGTNKKPAGPLALKTYRVEKIQLSPPITTDIKGQTKRVDTAYRVTVTGGPFPVRALLNIMCVDGVSIPASTNEDLTALVGVTFDASLIHDGATIAVGYGNTDSPCDSSLDSYSVLPEKIKLGTRR